MLQVAMNLNHTWWCRSGLSINDSKKSSYLGTQKYYHGEDHILILTVKYDCQKSDLEIMILSENETNSKTCWTNHQNCVSHDQVILTGATHRRSGKMEFPKRNHLYTDWSENIAKNESYEDTVI